MDFEKGDRRNQDEVQKASCVLHDSEVTYTQKQAGRVKSHPRPAL